MYCPKHNCTANLCTISESCIAHSITDCTLCLPATTDTLRCVTGFARKLAALLQSGTSLPTSLAQLLYTELSSSAAQWGAAGVHFTAALWPAVLVPQAPLAATTAVHSTTASTAAVASVAGSASSTPTLKAATIEGMILE